MVEEWRDIVIEQNAVVYDYTGLYQVSNLGRVRNVKSGNIKKLSVNCKNGYVSVSLFKSGKRKVFYTHRLVATMFIPNPNNLEEVNHLSEVKTDNRVDNLEWCSHEYNMKYGSRNKRQSNTMTGRKPTNFKKVVCVETGQVFNTITEAKKWCDKGDIVACCQGRTKTAGGYHWQYVD